MKSPDDKTVKSVFLNNIDSYHGKNISKNFGNTVIGSTLLEQDEDNEEIMSEGSDGVVNASKEGCWNTIGTIKCEDENKKKVLEKEMTWEDVEMAFTEEDYRRRKAHPNFRENITAEKNTIKIGKTSAWSNEEYVEIYGSGENVIPTIHIKDLSS
ncbi:hypothetical protein A3Q56_01464 [Intoshia linei]|uniref:Uncharacterized protein n=1 Tax=Intoshia linei TaxID=1819745 RepID=A0A177B935_9BILA|nr:hypothetical protein A3Q56_01464 [Intoshia linei]